MRCAATDALISQSLPVDEPSVARLMLTVTACVTNSVFQTKGATSIIVGAERHSASAPLLKQQLATSTLFQEIAESYRLAKRKSVEKARHFVCQCWRARSAARS